MKFEELKPSLQAPLTIDSSDQAEVLVTYKPSGLKTHRSSPNDWGWVEWLEEKLQQKLFLFQRLDLGTSGLQLMAKSEKSAQVWTERLQQKRINKFYLFISKARSIDKRELTVSSHIAKERGLWVSSTDQTSNSETELQWLAQHGAYQLWLARPRTGKAHQIRLHAQAVGLSILGDSEHGGAPFFRLCLHALKMENPETNETWQAPAPLFFQDLTLLDNPDLCALLDAHHQREQLKRMGLLENTDCYRLAHQECPTLRIDRFGSQDWVYDYHHDQAQQAIETFLKITEQRPAFLREMKNRGHQPNEALLTVMNKPAPRWTAIENNLQFELRADQGLSPGLFLDQRENRHWVFRNSRNKKVLNLFSYTCGFSVFAAAGGAAEVVSVDVSTAFLDWGKTNFLLNDLNPQHFEFWSSDVLEFLKRTEKIGRRFDLIICDPPSFGRSKRGVFKIDKDLSELVRLSFPLLTPGGQLLLSSNYEQWNELQFEQQATKLLPAKSFTRREAPKPGLDFLEASPILKTLLMEKSR